MTFIGHRAKKPPTDLIKYLTTFIKHTAIIGSGRGQFS